MRQFRCCTRHIRVCAMHVSTLELKIHDTIEITPSAVCRTCKHEIITHGFVPAPRVFLLTDIRDRCVVAVFDDFKKLVQFRDKISERVHYVSRAFVMADYSPPDYLFDLERPNE